MTSTTSRGTSGRAGQRGVRMSRVDRLWTRSTMITGVGPIVVPSRAAVVAAFVAIAYAGPDARVGMRSSGGRRARWIYRTDDLAEYAESAVIDLPPGSDKADCDVDALLGRLSLDYGIDRPVTVFRGDRHVFTMVAHALGDGRLALALPSALVAHAQDGRLPRWATAPGEQHPLPTAAWHTFRDVSTVRALLAHRRAAPSRRAVAGGDRSDGDLVPFRASPAAVTERGAPGLNRDLQVWTRTNAPGSAHFAAVVTLVARALAEQGILCAPMLHMVYDLRRYLPRGRTTMASFVAGIDLPVDLDDPAGITDAVTRAAKVGRPLAALGSAAVRAPARARHAAREPEQRVPRRPTARLALSYVGPKTPEPTLPWETDAEDCHYWSRVDPADPTAMTLLVAVVGRRLQLSASFHDSVFDPAAVRRALRAAHDDMAGLMTRALHSRDARSRAQP